jgi:acetolactate synthase I/II/III large subunit
MTMNTSNAEFLATKGGQAATGPQSDSTSPTKQPAPEMIGAEMLVHALHAEGVEYVWGYPGGAVLFIYDEIFKQDKFEHILVRHEQAAVHAADGYARATGKVGVALVTSGPGVTNAVTGIATAYTDSIPMVIITGNVPTYAIGEDAFQEADTVGITRPIVKHNFLVKDVNDLAVTLDLYWSIFQRMFRQLKGPLSIPIV